MTSCELILRYDFPRIRDREAFAINVLRGQRGRARCSAWSTDRRVRHRDAMRVRTIGAAVRTGRRWLPVNVGASVFAWRPA